MLKKTKKMKAIKLNIPNYKNDKDYYKDRLKIHEMNGNEEMFEATKTKAFSQCPELKYESWDIETSDTGYRFVCLECPDNLACCMEVRSKTLRGKNVNSHVSPCAYMRLNVDKMIDQVNQKQ